MSGETTELDKLRADVIDLKNQLGLAKESDRCNRLRAWENLEKLRYYQEVFHAAVETAAQAVADARTGTPNVERKPS